MIRVLIVDDDPGYLLALDAYLASQPDVDIVGGTCSGDEAIELASSLNPDVVVMDLAMPGVDGIAATRAIVRRNPDARVLILTAHESSGARNRSIAAGAVGFVGKRASPSRLIGSIREASAGSYDEDSPQT